MDGSYIYEAHGKRGQRIVVFWRSYGDRSRTQNNHWYRGKMYSFEDLRDLRAESHFDQECTDEKFQKRFDDCQKAIAHLADTIARLQA